MIFTPQSSNVNEYIKYTDVIDYNDADVAALSEMIRRSSSSELEFIKAVYAYARDAIRHSADIAGNVVTCKASDVLRVKEGVCFAKSHLAAALLRYNGVPAGFCYQLLRLTEEKNSPLILHGLVAVYLEDMGKWIRLDVRGNKPGVDAQFSTETEQLAFPVRPEQGEKDFSVIFTAPDLNVIRALTLHKTVDALWANLPGTLARSA